MLTRREEHVSGGIFPQDIASKIERTNIGDTVKVPRWRLCNNGRYQTTTINAIVLAKYPHFAVTTEGDFRWTDIMIHERRKHEQRRSDRNAEDV